MLDSVVYFMTHEMGLIVAREDGSIVGHCRGDFSHDIAIETDHKLGRIMLRNVRLEEAHEVRFVRTKVRPTDTADRYSVTVQLLLQA